MTLFASPSWRVCVDLGETLKPKLYVLFALLSLTAAFASPALAANVPNWNSPTNDGTLEIVPFNAEFPQLLEAGTVIDADGVEFFIDTSAPFDTLVSLGHAVENGGPDTNDWELGINTSGFQPGPARLWAVATEGGVESAPVAIDVTLVDRINPAIASTSPAEFATISGSSFQLNVAATDNVGVVSGDYSLNGEDWTPLSVLGGNSFRTGVIDTTALPNGTTFIYLRVFDAQGNESGSFAPAFTVQNNVAPVLNLDEVEFYGTLMVDGPGIVAEGATATGFPEPTITTSWFVCDPTFHCTNHETLFYTPTAAELGYTVRLAVRATSWEGFAGSVSGSILVGTVFAAPVGPPADEPQMSPPPPPPPPPPPAPPVVIPQVKKTEVIIIEKKIDVADTKADKAVTESKAAEKQADKAKAEVKEAKDDLAAKKTALAKAAAANDQLNAPLKGAKGVAPSMKKAHADKAAKELAAAKKAVEDAEKKVAAAEKTALVAEQKANAAAKNAAASKKALDKTLEELAATTNQKPGIVKAEYKVDKAEEKVAKEVAEQKVAEQKVVKAKAEEKESKAAAGKASTEATAAKVEVKQTEAEVKVAKGKVNAIQEAAAKAKEKADKAKAELKAADTAKELAAAKQAATKAQEAVLAKLKAEAAAKAAEAKAKADAQAAELKAKKAELEAKNAEAKAKQAEADAAAKKKQAAAEKKDVTQSTTTLTTGLKELATQIKQAPPETMTNEVAAAVAKVDAAGKKAAEETQQEKVAAKAVADAKARLSAAKDAAKAAAKVVTEKEAAAADARKPLDNPKLGKLAPSPAKPKPDLATAEKAVTEAKAAEAKAKAGVEQAEKALASAESKAKAASASVAKSDAALTDSLKELAAARTK